MKKRLFLDHRLIQQSENLERTIAPCHLHEEPLTLDGSVIWKRNNLHLSWYRDEDGAFQGWTNGHQETAHLPFSGEQLYWKIRSDDGLHWMTVDGPTCALCVVKDEHDPDAARRYKTILQAALLLDEDGNVEAGPDEPEKLEAAYRADRHVEHGMVVATSPDGVKWHDYQPVVLNTYRDWHPGLHMGRNPDVGKEKFENRWWIPGESGWAGGDNFPCLLYLPETGKYVAYYRTNIDRRTSLCSGGRRERGVGRSESSDFDTWTPHELALRSNVDWQAACGHGKQDFYQLQVWPVGDIYLGIISVFYWEEDRNRLELAWSPDTVHWERICPYKDFIPHGTLGEFGGGCSYAAMRPQEIDGQVRVYFGADKGQHNHDSDRESTLKLACFQPDRFAGTGSQSMGSLVTTPLELTGGQLQVNVDASGGSLRAELRRENGAPAPGFSFADSAVVAGDHLSAALNWSNQNHLPAGRYHLAVELNHAILYTVEEV